MKTNRKKQIKEFIISSWNDTSYIAHESKKIRLLLTLSVTSVFAVTAHTMMKITENNEKPSERSVLSKLIDIDETSSSGYDCGKIFSIDAQEIAATYENNWQKFSAIPGFTGILGSASGGGAIMEWQSVLHSAASPINREMRCGDTIQTTLSYAGQMQATADLCKNFTPDICDSAVLCVLLRDGSILVAAGNNACTEADFFDDTKQNYIHSNYSAEPYAVGSVAKIIMARAVQLNDAVLPPEYSMYNTAFNDCSFISMPNGSKIHNHDYKNQDAYEDISAEPFYRSVSLSDAMCFSSNTYFVRHMEALGGFPAAYETVCRTFGLSAPIQTESMNLDPVSCQEDRIEYFSFGQDFCTSPIRLSELVNHAIGGDAYTPFFVASVSLPDGTEIYHANPKPRIELHFDVDENDDILRDAMADCFNYYNIDESLTAPYRAMINDDRFLAKSGTADTTEGCTNSVRVLSVLDENKQVTATACILIHNLKSDAGINNTNMFECLFNALEASGVIEKE